MELIPLIQAGAALYVLCVVVLALNRMSSDTRHTVRWSYIALAGGALAALASCLGARDISECIFAVGVALYIAVNRRKVNS